MAPNSIFSKIAEALKTARIGVIKSKDEDINREIRQNKRLRDELQGSNIGHIEAGRDVYIINTQKLHREIIDRLNKPCPPDEDYKIMESEFDVETTEFERKFDSTDNELFGKILPHLAPELRSILNLAIGAEYEYGAGHKEKAENIKKEIWEFYGKRGATLCNLYTSGYVDKILDYVQVVEKEMSDIELAKVVNARIEEFLMGPAKYIYFVDETDQVDALVSEAENGMEHEFKYIAFHGAGLNAIKTLALVNKLIETGSVKENYQLNWGIPEKGPPNAIFFVAELTRKDDG